ncbi:aKG-HExxH-type peptide beta-hydroxylase, partial [Streptomyces sparsus]
AAGELLHARHPRAAELLGLACRTVVPLPPAPRFRNASASYSEAFGSALISLPGDARELAVTAVHEARHSVLNALLHQLPLCGDTRPDGSPLLLHAPWRGDPRPPSGLLHGVYAFAGVAAFWRVERHSLTGPEAVLAHFEYALWRQAVGEVAETLRHHEVLTAWGRRFVDRVADEAAGWADDHVPEASRAPALAELADRRA